MSHFHPHDPIGDRLVTNLPGVGDLLGKNLCSAGFDKVYVCINFKEKILASIKNIFKNLFQAYVLLGQFLVLKKNRDLFVDWLKDFGANSEESEVCYQYLFDWCDEFL